jgi:hypothetical protein
VQKGPLKHRSVTLLPSDDDKEDDDDEEEDEDEDDDEDEDETEGDDEGDDTGEDEGDRKDSSAGKKGLSAFCCRDLINLFTSKLDMKSSCRFRTVNPCSTNIPKN